MSGQCENGMERGPEPVDKRCDGCEHEFQHAENRHYFSDGDGWVWCPDCCPGCKDDDYSAHEKGWSVHPDTDRSEVER